MREVARSEGGVQAGEAMVLGVAPQELVFDPWRFGQAAQELERERVPVLAFPQTDVRMVPASARLHAAIVEERLTLPNDAELASHAAHAIARHSRRGWRLDKAGRTF